MCGFVALTQMQGSSTVDLRDDFLADITWAGTGSFLVPSILGRSDCISCSAPIEVAGPLITLGLAVGFRVSLEVCVLLRVMKIYPVNVSGWACGDKRVAGCF